MTSVIINDYQINRKIVINFDKTDFDKIEINWHKSDRLLHDLQQYDTFSGKLLWSDLTPNDWKILIMENLHLLSNLSLDEQTDPSNPTVSSSNFLISGLIKCIEERSESKIELMHLNRVGQFELAFDYTACLNVKVERIKKEKDNIKDMFSIVVDNT